jgi:general stress protein 26
MHDLARVWDLIEKVGVGMFVTVTGADLRARPLEARPDRAGGVIWFVIDRRGAKDDEIAARSACCLTFVHASEKAYLSLTGHAETWSDPTMAGQIWRRTDDVWWPDGPHDPNVLVMRFTPTTAELWDGPASAAVAAFEFAKARITGDKPDLGECRKATIAMR